jgi:hypothetical protein
MAMYGNLGSRRHGSSEDLDSSFGLFLKYIQGSECTLYQHGCIPMVGNYAECHDILWCQVVGE